MKGITRQQRDQDRCERMEAEFIGGPFDGTRLFLDVVRDGPETIRVLEAGYEQQFRSVQSSEVERD